MHNDSENTNDQSQTTAADTESRGDVTRQKLLVAAIDVFGRRGFDGATTRALANAAGVNLQAIPYYFGGKQGLYIAAAEHIAGAIAGHLRTARDQARARLAACSEGGAAPPSVDEARELLSAMLGAMAGLFVSAESEPWARFLIREQMEPTEAFHRVYDNVMEPMLGIARRLCGAILGEDPDSEQVRLRTLSLVGGVMVFRVAHAAAMAQLEWEQVDDRKVAAVRKLAAELVASLRPREDRPC